MSVGAKFGENMKTNDANIDWRDSCPIHSHREPVWKNTIFLSHTSPLHSSAGGAVFLQSALIHIYVYVMCINAVSKIEFDFNENYRQCPELNMTMPMYKVWRTANPSRPLSSPSRCLCENKTAPWLSHNFYHLRMELPEKYYSLCFSVLAVFQVHSILCAEILNMFWLTSTHHILYMCLDCIS